MADFLNHTQDAHRVLCYVMSRLRSDSSTPEQIQEEYSAQGKFDIVRLSDDIKKMMGAKDGQLMISIKTLFDIVKIQENRISRLDEDVRYQYWFNVMMFFMTACSLIYAYNK